MGTPNAKPIQYIENKGSAQCKKETSVINTQGETIINKNQEIILNFIWISQNPNKIKKGKILIQSKLKVVFSLMVLIIRFRPI